MQINSHFILSVVTFGVLEVWVDEIWLNAGLIT